MKRKIFITFIVFVCFIAVLSHRVYAGGGGRAVITIDNAGVAGGKAASITALIYKDNEYKTSVDEFGVFRIANALPGQNCITTNQRSDNEGKIHGTCSSPVAGDMRVYIHFPDKVEDAQQYSVPILPQGAPVPAAVVSAGSYGPCGSGLTSYGWEPSNGRNCPKDHYDKWTAYCGNGYKQDVAINNCLHANELSDHPEWKAVAESICQNPRCNTPVVSSTPKPTARPTLVPTPTASVSAVTIATPILNATPSAAPSVSKESTGISRFFSVTRQAFLNFFQTFQLLWQKTK